MLPSFQMENHITKLELYVDLRLKRHGSFLTLNLVHEVIESPLKDSS